MFVGVGIRINCILSGCAWPGEERVSLGSLSQRRTGECCLNGHLISVRFVIRNEREGSTLTINKYHAKKVQLSLHVLPAAVADGIQELVVDRHQLAAIGTKAVEGPRTDEILHCPLVDVVIIHPLAEVLESGEGSVLLPLPHHVLNKAPANIFDGH